MDEYGRCVKYNDCFEFWNSWVRALFVNFKLPFILSVVRDCSISEACIFDNFNPHVFDILRVSALLPSLPFPSLLFSSLTFSPCSSVQNCSVWDMFRHGSFFFMPQKFYRRHGPLSSSGAISPRSLALFRRWQSMETLPLERRFRCKIVQWWALLDDPTG